MINIKVILEDGNTFTTRMNCTLSKAIEYYVGNSFTFGTDSSNEVSVKCTEVLLTVFSEEVLKIDGLVDCFRINGDEFQLRYEDGNGHFNEGFVVTHYNDTVQRIRTTVGTYNEAVKLFTKLVSKVY